MNDTMRLTVITGSVRDGRFGPTVSNWIARVAAQRPEFEVDVIDLAELDIPADMSVSADQQVFAEKIDASDAIIVVTPEYNHSFPGPLKTAIDSLKTQWQGKPIGFVSYGGISGGLRAVEALRIVFAELHAVTVRDVVAFPMAWTKFDENGDPVERDVVSVAADALLNNLAWWAAALKKARAEVPYGQELAMAR